MGKDEIRPKYSIVIPSYKSTESLPVLMKELSEVMAEVGKDYEVIFVDDCSPDDTWQTMLKINAEYAEARIIRLSNNFGQWMASLCGISRARGETIITLDDDLEYDTRDVKKIIDYFESNDYYLVYGIAEDKSKKNLSHKLFYKPRNYMVNTFLGKQQTDSFKIFSRNLMFGGSSEFLSKLHFEAFTNFILAPRYVGYIDVSYRTRAFGSSNHNLYKKIKILLKYSFEYFQFPLKPVVYLGIFLVFASFLLPLIGAITEIPEKWTELMGLFFIPFSAGISFIIFGVFGIYLANIFLMKKGKPEYLIIDEK